MRWENRTKCSFHTFAPNLSQESGWVKSNSVVPLTVSIEQVSNNTVPLSASAILSGGTRSLSLKFNRVVKLLSTQFVAERKGQIYADKWAALVQLRWVLEASKHYPGNHRIYGSADHNLEWIHWLFGNLLSFAWGWSVDLVASLYIFFSGGYLLLQNTKKVPFKPARMNKEAFS